MSLRYGLQARFLGMMALALVVVLTLMALLWSRQEGSQGEVENVSREAMDSMSNASLRRRGEGMVTQLAEALANPVYYFDLDAMGVMARAALRQPGIGYITVYDAEGKVLHDGSEEIVGYGTRMDDPLAFEVISARQLHMQWSEDILDVSARS